MAYPVKAWFEQYVNGAMIEQMGYGRCFTAFSSDAIKAYLYDLERFSETLFAYRQDGNRRTFDAVDRFLGDVAAGTIDPADEVS